MRGLGAARARTALVLSLLVLSTASGRILASGTPTNWINMNANSNGTNYVDQDQLSAGNVAQLSLNWIFPFPTGSASSGTIRSGQGVISPPLSVDGIVYLVTNFFRVYAIDAQTGAEIWHYDPPLNSTGLPIGEVVGHMHGVNYYNGTVWVSLPDCSVLGLDALTGALSARIGRICAGIQGNAGLYDSSGNPPVFSKNTMIWTSSVTEGTDAGRGFVAAYDLRNGKLLWRWYASPPAGGDPDWDFSSCPSPCHGNVAPMTGDWGTALNQGTRSLTGAGPAWGQPAVDARRGVVYVGTSQPSPDWNATYRPGPNLYSDSVVALNVTDGRLLWFFQTTPHDLFDFDCGWNVALANVTMDGRSEAAVIKACKNGYVYAMNAATGTLLWYFDPPAVARSGTSNADYVSTGKYDPTQPWINYPSGGQFRQCPGTNGGEESDISVAYGRVYVATHNFCTFVQVAPVNKFGNNWGTMYLQPDWKNANTTIYAIDASTGKQVWSFFLPSVPFRGWLTTTGGLVMASALDGYIHFLDANTGSEVYKLRLGPSLYEGPTVGSTASGEVQLYQLTSSPSYGSFSAAVPGALLAFGMEPAENVAPSDIAVYAIAGSVVSAVLLLAWVVLRKNVGRPISVRAEVFGDVQRVKPLSFP